jgi:23S rRNA (cytidine1920-2'-O)/16S rRNA (cytidine1409-2'-O)-methyltransferase
MRLDQQLVSLGLVESRAKGRAAIEAGGVTVDGHPAKAPSQAVTEDSVITYQAAFPWVGRGALKLEEALNLWPVKVEGRVALDVGASTGGFTEVCLSKGAVKVYAVDVGTAQLHPRIAADPRVINLEQTDARLLTPDLIPIAPELVVCDASFISQAKVLPAALNLAARGADLISLIKPQFEADSPKGVGKKGVVKSPEAHAAAATAVGDWLAVSGWTVNAIADSPILGADGNKEFLIWATKA